MTLNGTQLEAIECLRKATEDLGHSPSYPEYQEFCRGRDDILSERTIINRLGSWNEAKEYAELETFKPDRDEPPHFHTGSLGYERIEHETDGEKHKVRIHRLMGTLMVDDISELKGKDIHHIQPIPWLNTFDNLEVLTPEEHQRNHGQDQERYFDDGKRISFATRKMNEIKERRSRGDGG